MSEQEKATREKVLNVTRYNCDCLPAGTDGRPSDDPDAVHAERWVMLADDVEAALAQPSTEAQPCIHCGVQGAVVCPLCRGDIAATPDAQTARLIAELRTLCESLRIYHTNGGFECYSREHESAERVLAALSASSSTPRGDYDAVEMACKGCMGPCGRCHEAPSTQEPGQ